MFKGPKKGRFSNDPQSNPLESSMNNAATTAAMHDTRDDQDPQTARYTMMTEQTPHDLQGSPSPYPTNL